MLDGVRNDLDDINEVSIYAITVSALDTKSSIFHAL